jgi:hypothetical protein
LPAAAYAAALAPSGEPGEGERVAWKKRLHLDVQGDASQPFRHLSTWITPRMKNELKTEEGGKELPSNYAMVD